MTTTMIPEPGTLALAALAAFGAVPIAAQAVALVLPDGRSLDLLVTGPDDGDLLDRRMLCLDERLARVEATVELFASDEQTRAWEAKSATVTGLWSFFSSVAAASSLAMSVLSDAACENSSTKIGAFSSAPAVTVRQSSPAPSSASYQLSTPRSFRRRCSSSAFAWSDRR